MVSYIKKKDEDKILLVQFTKLEINDSEGEDPALNWKLPAGVEVVRVGETECRTPIAKEAKIQEAETCPPAPMKRKVCLFGNGNEPEKIADVK
ncbi:hypothetical protein SLE2022_241110 [Rubroshorea leprosula]